MNDLIIREQELIQNPTARVPICLVLDTSGSMLGNPINELNKGILMFFDAIKNDEIARYSAEVSIVTFGDSAKKILDFDCINNQTMPYLSASGLTPMGDAVNMALDLLEQRKKEYSNAGVDYYQPWLVLMSDGAPTDSVDIVIERTCELVNSKKLTIFPVIIGNDRGARLISRFSPNRDALQLKGFNFQEFFEWLSQSVSRVSQSTPGEKVDLDIEGIKGWATL
jgi:uncharacterized protein YegL